MAKSPGDQDLRAIAAGRPDVAERSPFEFVVVIDSASRVPCPVPGLSISTRGVITDVVVTGDCAEARHLDLFEGDSLSATHRFSIQGSGSISWPRRTSWVLPRGISPQAQVSDLGAGEEIQANFAGYVE
jgi:hypothetical protein